MPITPGHQQKLKLWLALTIFLGAAVFLFSGLGHYALWDDEAMTGLIAQGVLKTGDTSALLDHNIVAYGDGLLLRNLHDRSTAPLPAYLTAVSFALFGPSAWAARLPFALLGLATIGLMLFWAIRENVRVPTLLLLGIALLGNVSFFLFCRNARYFAPSIFFSIALVYLYVHGKRKRPSILAFIFLSLLLLATLYMAWAALYLCLAVDYFLWGKKKHPLSGRDWLFLLLPQIILGGILIFIWNPAATGSKSNLLASNLLDRLQYIPAFLRDLNVCEFGLAFLILLAPLLYLRRRSAAFRPLHRANIEGKNDSGPLASTTLKRPEGRDPYNPWLIRLPVALLIYIIAIALLCPFKAAGFTEGLSQIRYLCPTIPLWIALGVLVITEIAGSRLCLLIALGVLSFWFNYISLNWLIPFRYLDIKPHSTLLSYVRELHHPPPDPFTTASNWINQNIKPRQSLWVRPNFATYPLMFHAPSATYAWQLPFPPQDSSLAALPQIHFAGKEPPDYMIAFMGNAKAEVQEMIEQMRPFGFHYRALPPLPCFGRDVYRPELFLRVSQSVTNFDLNTQAIYIFERIQDKPLP